MIQTSAVSAELESLLGLIAEHLQLPPSLDSKARERYGSLTTYLQSTSLARYPISVYAQGSYRIGTTVKPLSGDEFDLDFVVELVLPSLVDPGDLVAAVWNEIRKNGNYAGMIERRPSCIRLLYADEFHMDIVPAVPDAKHGGTAILIPRETNGALRWHATNPRGYAAWFESQAARRVITKEMAVEPLPKPLPAEEKSPLQTSVQLYKRHHHIAVEDEHFRTPSVVLTTILTETASEGTTLSEIISRLVEAIGQYEEAATPPAVLNPAAEHELISDKWVSDARVFGAFRVQSARLRSDWVELLELQGAGRPPLVKKLSEMFGVYAVQRAEKAMAERVRAAAVEGRLATISGGALVIGTTRRPNPRHTPYGDE